MKDQPLRDARGNIHGFSRTLGNGDVIFTNVQGKHLGYVTSDGKTRDSRMNIISHQARPDLALRGLR
jgi:hypothetical protein